MDTIPHRQPLFIGGDFNARLHYRPRDEQEHIGPYVYGRGEHYASSTCIKTQENKDLFLAWIKSNSLHVTNTWFQKPHKKLITYRELGTPPGNDVEDATKFAQLDFLICRPRFKNAVLNIESDMRFWQHSNHYLLMAHIRVKLKHKEYPAQGKPDFSNSQAMEAYTERIAEQLQAYSPDAPEPTWEDLAALITEERERLPTTHHTLWKPYITDYTKTLIEARNNLAA